MRFAIYGAGAIGAYLGAKLAAAGEDVSLIARGPHLRALQEHGVRVRSPDGDFEAKPLATDDPREVGEVDYLVLAVKAHGLTAIAPLLAPLLGDATAVVPAQNGIPWWYFSRHGGPWEGTRLESADPGGVIAAHISPERIIGCVVYPAVAIVEPGVIEHTEGDRFSIGELDGSTSERCRALSTAIGRAGLRAPIRSNIREEIWVKLLGNSAFNPVSALTRASLAEIAADPDARALVQAMMEEIYGVAAELGIDIPVSIEARMAGAEAVGAHKTSMLQDVEAAKPLEVDGLVGTVLELGRMLGRPMPCTSAVYACAKLLGAKAVEAAAG
ncbi:MAG: 2-dehydropantoate 2-reductase [Chloroflexi bacterium]|nr:2-dehydropantoate 2-reductase [Chloroflexota bacterium]MCI0820709.1 2-dehydropantoate 2-reductase [Chloroflexota bacterium]MCI0888490.1 2-dehydropantoate 2-reductase [Chloroflexota bacterium]